MPKSSDTASRGSWLARLLDLRCPNCHTRTARTLLWRCDMCGYPSRRALTCPSCGKQTARTRDMVCRWCGYQLQLGAPAQAAPVPAPERPSEPVPVTPPAPVVAETPVPAAPPPLPAPAPSPTLPSTPGPVPAPASPAATAEPDAPVPLEKAPVPPVSGDVLPTTVEELHGDFLTDAVLADQKYRGRMLKVKGVVLEARIAEGAVATLVLGSTDGDSPRVVQCAFEGKYAPLVGRMVVGTRVAIMGRYDGFDKDVRLTDCLPVG